MNRIITVAREFGSGGRELGRRIAQELNIAYYDHEIVLELSRRTQTPSSPWTRWAAAWCRWTGRSGSTGRVSSES